MSKTSAIPLSLLVIHDTQIQVGAGVPAVTREHLPKKQGASGRMHFFDLYLCIQYQFLEAHLGGIFFGLFELSGKRCIFLAPAALIRTLIIEGHFAVDIDHGYSHAGQAAAVCGDTGDSAFKRLAWSQVGSDIQY